ncbi:hypothetical protein D3C85_1354790 [compost metagenome]
MLVYIITGLQTNNLAIIQGNAYGYFLRIYEYVITFGYICQVGYVIRRIVDNSLHVLITFGVQEMGCTPVGFFIRNGP